MCAAYPSAFIARRSVPRAPDPAVEVDDDPAVACAPLCIRLCTYNWSLEVNAVLCSGCVCSSRFCRKSCAPRTNQLTLQAVRLLQLLILSLRLMMIQQWHELRFVFAFVPAICQLGVNVVLCSGCVCSSRFCCQPCAPRTRQLALHAIRLL